MRSVGWAHWKVRRPRSRRSRRTFRKLRPRTLVAINQWVVTSRAARAVESGRTVRIDRTVVTGWLHAPTDSSLLVDGIRVLMRLLRRAEHLTGFTAYHTHLKRAKRRLLAIQHAATSAVGARRRAYRDLLTLAQATTDYAACALVHVQTMQTIVAPARGNLSRQLMHDLPFLKRTFGLERCTWKGDIGFVAYVHLGVLTANLLTLARHRLP